MHRPVLPRPLRRLLGVAGYALIAVSPPLLAVAVFAAGLIAQNPTGPAPAFAGALPDFPTHDAAKRTAVIVAGNAATEVSDLLGPYEVLAASGAFNVYVVAPERVPTPLVPVPAVHCCATVDMVPHYSFAEYDRLVGVAPDLIVVPYIPFTDGADAAVLGWLRSRPGENTVVLSICGGAQMVADSGILAGHRATTHHNTLPIVARTHPEVDWVSGVRYVDDGRFISSAGVTSGVDATLYTLQRFLGRAAAAETARRVGYPHTRFLDETEWTVPGDHDTATLPNLFRFGRAKIGLYLYAGVGEIEVSSVTDTYPRALATDVLTVGAERTVIRTRHGLGLIPRHTLASLPPTDRMLVPGGPSADALGPVQRWASLSGRPAVEPVHAAGGFAYDLTFADMARHETRLIVKNAARWIEYPTAHLDLGQQDWSPAMVARPFALLALGVALATVVARKRRGGSAEPAPLPARSASMRA